MSHTSTATQVHALSHPELRHARTQLYRFLVEHARAPSPAELGGILGTPPDVTARTLRALQDVHAILLAEDGSVHMAWPFSNVETPFPVRVDGRVYHANCAWDALGIPAALNMDADLMVHCAQSNAPLPLSIRNGNLLGPDARVHFAVPFSRWYEDLVST